MFLITLLVALSLTDPAPYAKLHMTLQAIFLVLVPLLNISTSAGTTRLFVSSKIPF
jgi:hypothetical protein